MAPSAVSTAKTARLLPSGDMPTNALAMAPVRKSPATICWGRLVMSPTNTPPANLLGAPASGMPPGSMIESRPLPCAPVGALVNHIRPNALLIEMPRGLLTDGCDAEAACGVVTELRNASDLRGKELNPSVQALRLTASARRRESGTTIVGSVGIDRQDRALGDVLERERRAEVRARRPARASGREFDPAG